MGFIRAIPKAALCNTYRNLHVCLSKKWHNNHQHPVTHLLYMFNVYLIWLYSIYLSITNVRFWDKARIGLFGDLLHFIEAQEYRGPVETVYNVCFINTWKVNELSRGPHMFPSAKWYLLRFKIPFYMSHEDFILQRGHFIEINSQMMILKTYVRLDLERIVTYKYIKF